MAPPPLNHWRRVIAAKEFGSGGINWGGNDGVTEQPAFEKDVRYAMEGAAWLRNLNELLGDRILENLAILVFVTGFST